MDRKSRALNEASDAIKASAAVVESYAAKIKADARAGNIPSSKGEMERIRIELIDILGASITLSFDQRFGFINMLDRFIANPKDKTEWERLSRSANSILHQVDSLLFQIRSQRNDYILEDSYMKFHESLHGRQEALHQILSLDKPPKDMVALRRFRDSYVLLIKSLEAANKELSEYLKKPDEISDDHIFKQSMDRITKSAALLGEAAIAPSNLEAAKGPIFLISILGAFAGIVFAAFGVWLVIGGGETGASTVRLFGQTIETTSVGIAAIFIGAVTVVVTLRRVLKTMDTAIRK